MMTQEMYAKVIRVLLRRARVRLGIVGAFAFAVGVLVLLLDPLRYLPVSAGLVTLGLMVALFLPWRIARLSARNAAPALVAPWRYELGEESLRVTTAMATTEWQWRAMTAVEDHPEFWLLRTNIKGHAVIVLKAAFAESDRPAVAQRLHGWLGHVPAV